MRTDTADALTHRVNESAQPSRLINHLQEVDARCSAATQHLQQLMTRAPRCLSVIRRALREAFALDPDNLLFSEPGTLALGPQVSTLTERALALLSHPGVPANLNHFTRLSLKDDPQRRLTLTAWDAMERVRQLGLLERLDTAARRYWQQLAYGTWLTRAEHWLALKKSLFADKALLALQRFELSAPGYELVRQLADAPSAEARARAGGAWADVQVRTLLWPGTYQPTLAIPGALHVYRSEQGVQVIYLPGLAREFYEFQAWSQMHCDLPPLLNGALFEHLWQCLPLRRRHEVCPAGPVPVRGPLWTGDALAHSALAVREGQWDNELACALSINPGWVSFSAQAQAVGRDVGRYLARVERARKQLPGEACLGPLRNPLLEWDRQRRAPEISFDSLPADLPVLTRHQQVRRYETALLALLDPRDPGTTSAAYQGILDLEAQWHTHAGQVQSFAQGPQDRLFDSRYWLERNDDSHKRVDRLLHAQCKALLCEARIQHRLKLIDSADLSQWERVLQVPVVTQADKWQVSIGADGPSRQPLLGVLVVPVARSVLLWVAGRMGGLLKFESLDALSGALKASLLSADGSELWRCVPRDRREAARAALKDAAWHVAYAAIERHPLQHLFIGLISDYARLEKTLAQPAALFSEVSDPDLARVLLAGELSEQLQVPFNAALAQALATVNLWRLAAAQARHRPAWLAAATATRRTTYRRLQRHYLAGAMAFEDKLWQVLPSLDTFARTQLIQRLTQDGLYPEVDIDQPLLDMPDDVSKHFCGWSSQCVVGDRHVKTVVSAQRSRFSLLQLALHNLDPQAPWTEWRLNRARYLAPTWKERLAPAYLIQMIAELDIGGHYQRLVRQAFYSAATGGLIRALSERALYQQARMQLYSALREGLAPEARSLFETALAARAAADLRNHGHDLQLCYLRLVGHTLEHDRHVAGVLVFHDRASGRCVVYWPGAEAFAAISAYPSVDAAHRALNRQAASALVVKRLARQVAPGWEHEALASYPGAVANAGAGPRWAFTRSRIAGFRVLSIREAIARFVRAFKVKHRTPVAALEVIEAHIHEQIAAAPEGWLGITPTTHSHPLALLTHARLLEIQHRSQGFANTAVMLATQREQRLGEQRDATLRGLLSFIPVIGIGISLYEMLLAARRYHHSGDPRDAVDVAFMTLLAFVDVMSAWVPGPRGRGVMRGSLQRLRAHAPLARSGFPSQRSVLAKPPRILERFKKEPLVPGAVPLQGGAGVGLHVHDGEQFLVVDGHRYPVYRRSDEPVLRLKNQGHDELILHIEQPREWLLGADAPQPGPSSRVWRPWDPAPVMTEWTPPTLGAITQRVQRLPLAGSGWQAWGFTGDLRLVPVSPPRRIFDAVLHPAGDRFRVIQLGPTYFRLLPDGAGASSEHIVFVTRNRPPAFMASSDIHRWLDDGFAEQPLPATRGADGLWTLHRPLLTEPLTVSLQRAFPNMTSSSRFFVSERLIQLADPNRFVTASHLLGIRATLDKWLNPQALGQTDDLLRMLRPLSLRSSSVYIGYDAFTPGFGHLKLTSGLNRLDFIAPHALEASLRTPNRHNMTARAHAVHVAVRQVLEQQGFILKPLEKRPGAHFLVDFFCAHPDSDNRYFVLTRWTSDTRVKLNVTQDVQMTDEWIIRRSTMGEYADDFQPIKKALDEQRLVRVIAGIQWTGRAQPTVYFIKLEPTRAPTLRRPLPRTDRR